MPDAIVPSGFSVEWRDKDGNFKGYLTPYLSKKPTWEWNRKGGCGVCTITLKKNYRDFVFSARDDIRIRIKSGSTSKLVYRGYISEVTPTLQKDSSVVLKVKGYFDLLKKLIVHDTGDIKTYTSQEISVIVDDIIDTFVVANTSITKGTIDVGTFVADSIQFLNTVENCLSTLADLLGTIEYGVDENLVFFWREESTTIKHKFFAKGSIKVLERRVNFENIVNKIYLVGGEVSGSKYKKLGENTDSQSQYGLFEEIVNNGSIVSDTVADEYISSTIRQKAQPILSIRAQVPNTTKRFEDTVPLGLISFYDAKYDKNLLGDLVGDIIGEAADGGSDITVGEAADGGSDVTVGGQYAAQVERITYEPSNTPGRLNATIQFGDTVLETAAKIKKLELALNNIQQY